MCRKMQKVIFISMTFLFFIGCGYKEGVVQSSPKSYLWFTGESEYAVVFIDDKEPFELKKSYYTDEETGRKIKEKSLTYYQVEPGKHRIVVKKNELVVIDRVIILGNGITKEIQIP